MINVVPDPELRTADRAAEWMCHTWDGAGRGCQQWGEPCLGRCMHKEGAGERPMPPAPAQGHPEQARDPCWCPHRVADFLFVALVTHVITSVYTATGDLSVPPGWMLHGGRGTTPWGPE